MRTVRVISQRMRKKVHISAQHEANSREGEPHDEQGKGELIVVAHGQVP